MLQGEFVPRPGVAFFSAHLLSAGLSFVGAGLCWRGEEGKDLPDTPYQGKGAAPTENKASSHSLFII